MQVTRDEGNALADKLGVPLRETSALTGSGIFQAYETLVKLIPRASSAYKVRIKLQSFTLSCTQYLLIGIINLSGISYYLINIYSLPEKILPLVQGLVMHSGIVNGHKLPCDAHAVLEQHRGTAALFIFY